MSYTFPNHRLCDCHCPTHHGLSRVAYRESDCTCTITCATQHLSVIVEQWRCALFIDHHDTLIRVPATEDGNWDWANATALEDLGEQYERGELVEASLRALAFEVDRSIGVDW